MLRVLDDRGRGAKFASRPLQLDGVDQLSAFVTLVAPGVVVAAQWARPFHETIRQEPVQSKRHILIRTSSNPTK